jgi:hypothetical protein
MVERDDGVRASLGDVLKPGRFDAKEGAKDKPEEIAQGACRHGSVNPGRA